MKFLLAASFSALLASASAVASVDENCFVSSSAHVFLESCEAALASAQGKEIWTSATDGSLVLHRPKSV